MTNIKCGNCSTFQSPVYHGSVDAVRACFATKYAPKTVATPVVEVPASAKKYNRYSAKCPAKSCKVASVQSASFDLVCTEHQTVTTAKQLQGSQSVKHKCDDRCIYAVGSVCVCGCGGVNHGVGLLKLVHEVNV